MMPARMPAIHMNTKTKTGLEILQIAIGLGILGDVLLRQKPWGLNVLLFNLAFADKLLLCARRPCERHEQHHQQGRE